MYTITKEFHFSAAHQLIHLPDGHPCKRLHGHNYIVKVELKSKKLNKDQFVRDYGELRGIKLYLDDVLDHKNLNEVFPNMAPTAENLAKRLFDFWRTSIPELSAIEISETPLTNARYEASNPTY